MRFRRSILLSLVDLSLSLAAVSLSILLRFEGEIPARYFAAGQHLYLFSAGMALACVVMFHVFGLYEKVWRYAGIHELLTIVYAVTVALAPFFLYAMITGGRVYPRGVIVIVWLSSIFFLGGIRFILRIASQETAPGRVQADKRVLIVGANDVGEMALRELQRHRFSGYLPVGFIDDDPSRKNVVIHGVPVLGGKEDLYRLIEERHIDELIIAFSSPSLVRSIVTQCEKLKVGLKIIPSLSEIIDGRVAVNQIREVQIQDLLEREPVSLDMERISSYIKDKRIMITGAGGSIGSEICRQIVRLCPGELILLGHGENSIYEICVELSRKTEVPLRSVIGDIRDYNRLNHIFSLYRPQVVFHAAAHKHVPLMENNIVEAVSNNIFGTRNLVELSDRHGVERFIFLSTDKAVNPVSIMGSTKRMAELIVTRMARNSKTEYVAVRFGNVLGSRGSVVPTFAQQIKMGGPVTVTSENMTRFFMTIPEAVQLVIQAGAVGGHGEIFILDMGKPIRIIDLAKNMIRLSGFEVGTDIKIEVRGTRPGEKIEEELVNYGECLEKTEVPKILRVAAGEVHVEELEKYLESLKEAVEKQSEEQARSTLVSALSLFSGPESCNENNP
ncbi:MAG: polysaccharide biosynthesis protein [Vulcanimicrobiota bacterium]